MMQKGKSRNVLASPLGEEGHEVAKGCTRVRMIMILDVDVTAEKRHYNTYRPAGDTTTLGPKGRRPLSASEHNPPPSSGHNPRGEAPSTLTPKACPRAIRNPRPEGPSNLRTLRSKGPVHLKNPHTEGVSKGGAAAIKNACHILMAGIWICCIISNG